MLPKDYTAPEGNSVSDGYMNKFEVGENKIRILSDIQTGFEWHVDPNGNNVGDRQLVKGDKPVRVRTFKEAVSNDNSEPYRHFWVMVVWNYAKEAVQVLEIKQAKIQTAIEAYEKDGDWGDTRNYDLVIKREGQGFNDTKYAVIAKPAKPLSKEILAKALATPINLDVWFSGGNPFLKAEPTGEDVANEIPF